MVNKSFRVTIYFDLHQVSCPGVWLCPKGKIFLTVSLFRCVETTKQVHPVFPLKYYERFIFDKVFDNVQSLTELQELMKTKDIKLEMVQIFQGKRKMITLGIFQAPLTNILYPYISDKSESGTAEIDLLFEPCKPYPGIISPKAEVTTRAVVEELKLCPKYTEGPVNPTLVTSCKKTRVRSRSRQRPVCHTRQKVVCACSRKASPPGTSTRRLSGPRDESEASIRGGGEETDSSALIVRRAEQGRRVRQSVEVELGGGKEGSGGEPGPAASAEPRQGSLRKSASLSSYEEDLEGGRPECDCYASRLSRDTVNSAAVPWKVYRAPEVGVCACVEPRGESSAVRRSHTRTQTEAVCHCEDAHREWQQQREESSKERVNKQSSDRSQRDLNRRGGRRKPAAEAREEPGMSHHQGKEDGREPKGLNGGRCGCQAGGRPRGRIEPREAALCSYRRCVRECFRKACRTRCTTAPSNHNLSCNTPSKHKCHCCCCYCFSKN